MKNGEDNRSKCKEAGFNPVGRPALILAVLVDFQAPRQIESSARIEELKNRAAKLGRNLAALNRSWGSNSDLDYSMTSCPSRCSKLRQISQTGRSQENRSDSSASERGPGLEIAI